MDETLLIVGIAIAVGIGLTKIGGALPETADQLTDPIEDVTGIVPWAESTFDRWTWFIGDGEGWL